ncbi:MAG: hypothetical protein ACRDRK_15795 [Pseudonocardia sp.]
MIRSYVRRGRRFVGLISWTVGDQFLFALSSLVVTLAVARGGGAEALGRFSVAFAAYLIVLGFSRALVSEPLLAIPRDEDRTGEAESTTLTMLFAAAGATVVGVVGLLLGRVELLVVAAALPAALIQDVLRYHAFHRGQPARAALLDGGWLLASVITWPIVTAAGSTTVALACWAAGAVLSIGLGWRALRPRLCGLGVAFAWWRAKARSLANPLLLDGIAYVMSVQGVVFIVASMAGDDQLGVLRAGQVYFAPLTLLLVAVGVLAVPQLAQRAHLHTGVVAARLAVAAALVMAILSAAILAAAPLLHSLLYGDSILVPNVLLVPLAVMVIITGASTGLVVITRTRHRGGDLSRSRISSAVVGVGLAAWMTAEFGVVGAAWALVGQALCYLAHLGMLVKLGNPVRATPDKTEVRGETVVREIS